MTSIYQFKTRECERLYREMYVNNCLCCLGDCELEDSRRNDDPTLQKLDIFLDTSRTFLKSLKELGSALIALIKSYMFD